MGPFKKKPDPISDRERALNAEIAALDAQIKQLTTRAEPTRNQPRLRSTVAPAGQSAAAPCSPQNPEPVFEKVDQNRLKTADATTVTASDNPGLGVREHSLRALWRRLQNQFTRPPSNNPRLVNYLAAGSIQGLRPLRYEKRVARNRAIFLFICLVLVIYVIYAIIK